MNSPLLRGYTLLNAAVMAFAMALTFNYLLGYQYRSGLELKGEVQHVKTVELKTIPGQVDRAVLKLFMRYDLRDAFDWSTNTVFLYVTANYETAKHRRNELIVHDKIIRNRSEAYEPGKDFLSKYYMVDYGRSLRQTPVTLRLYYSVIPIGGVIETYELAKSQFSLPSEYVLPTAA